MKPVTPTNWYTQGPPLHLSRPNVEDVFQSILLNKTNLEKVWFKNDFKTKYGVKYDWLKHYIANVGKAHMVIGRSWNIHNRDSLVFWFLVILSNESTNVLHKFLRSMLNKLYKLE